MWLTGRVGEIYEPPYPAHFGADPLLRVMSTVTVTHVVLPSRYDIKNNRERHNKQVLIDREVSLTA